MKKKIGEIYNIPIIIGDKNLKTKNEIHVDDLSNVVGSGEAEVKDTMEYLDVSGLSGDASIDILTTFAVFFKGTVGGAKMYGTIGLLINQNYTLEALAIDFTAPIYSESIGIVSVSQAVEMYGLTSEQLAAIPRITKEEFYNLSFEEDSGGLKEGDVLYYSCPSTSADTDTLKDLIKVKDNIVTVAAARAETDTGSFPTIQSFINGENLEWTENTTYGYVSVTTSNYIGLDIIGFSFRVGSDLKTTLDIIGTPVGGEITQITEEEYENIFNS